MALVPVLSFLLLLVFGSVDSWAACWTVYGESSCSVSCTESIPDCPVSFSATCGKVNYVGRGGSFSCVVNECRGGAWNTLVVTRCNTQCEVDSVANYSSCVSSGGTWENCECKQNYHDTTFVCQNVGNVDVWSGGYPAKAQIFTCIDDVCENTATLAGTCHDWGFCPDGVESCEISKDSTGRRPCKRSGPETTHGALCYYQCVDGKQLRCRPNSTQYVAGSIYVGTCPEYPSASCDPPPNFSSSSTSPASSGSSGTSSGSGSGGTSSGSGSGGGDSSGSSGGPDYMPILEAIRDTLHLANVQRSALENYAISALPAIEDIGQSAFEISRIDNQINNRLLTLQENGVKLEKSSKASIDSSAGILQEIRNYLKHDSLVVYSHDTSYNPFLRDIQAAIETQTDSIVTVSRDVVLRDSVGRIPPVDTSLLNRALYQLVNNFAPADSVKRRHCAELNECLATSSTPVECYNSSNRQCYDGGTPFDGLWNVEFGVLETLWKGFWGEDSTPLKTSQPDTDWVAPPAADSAQNSLLSAISSLFSSDTVRARMQKVDSMKQAAMKKDSTKIQPDSLWLDSANAAKYVEHNMINAPTVEACFVCHAELGTLGGLAPDGLVIHIDFANIGGFNICAIIRTVVRIMTFVICLSLTLGSWAAAFGYNPKNDA